MNENEILDNLNTEDIDVEIESEDLTKNETEEVVETTSLPDELDLDVFEDEEITSIDESLNEVIDDLDALISDNEENITLEEEPESTENIVDEDISEEETELVDDSESIEESEEVSMLEKYILDEENETEKISENSDIEDTDITLEEEAIEEQSEVIEPVEEEIKNDSLSLADEEDNLEDENFITNDLDNINIEFGIEAKGFILSLKMMEAMIEKGYIFKDILNDKVFDAVMIFNGNLENTVMTNDIKIKIEDGKIQLIKG